MNDHPDRDDFDREDQDLLVHIQNALNAPKSLSMPEFSINTREGALAAARQLDLLLDRLGAFISVVKALKALAKAKMRRRPKACRRASWKMRRMHRADTRFPSGMRLKRQRRNTGVSAMRTRRR